MRQLLVRAGPGANVLELIQKIVDIAVTAFEVLQVSKIIEACLSWRCCIIIAIVDIGQYLRPSRHRQCRRPIVLIILSQRTHAQIFKTAQGGASAANISSGNRGRGGCASLRHRRLVRTRAVLLHLKLFKEGQFGRCLIVNSCRLHFTR